MRSTRRPAASRDARRAPAPRRLLLGALGAAGATVLGVLAGGGTFAVWTAATPVASAVTLQAGSAGLTATPLSLSAANLYPGRTVFAPTTVRNTGTVPLALTLDPVTSSAGATAFTTAVLVTAGAAASGAACTAGAVPAAVSTRVGAAGADLQVTLAPGASQIVCVGVGLPHDAPAGAAGSAASVLTLTVSGMQVPR
ncbi:hypothetical protein [Microbacterium atlanticum]|uniref:hypothetical protein n=1 Tax=Microbacterium atlanticum TaxID=2782168 RepID=UPI001889A145|nr:hypothetical protein [Microbacterium atlanticum]